MPIFSASPFARRAQPAPEKADESPARSRDGSKNVFAGVDEPADKARSKGSVSKLIWNLGSTRPIVGVKLPQIGSFNGELKRASSTEAGSSPTRADAQARARSPPPGAKVLPRAGSGDSLVRDAGKDAVGRAPQKADELDLVEGAHRRPLPIGESLPGPGSLNEMKAHMISDARVQDEVIPSVCVILELTVAAHTEAEVETVPGLEVFDGSTTPVSITAYVQRILKYSNCSTCNLVIGLMYLERLKTRHRKLKLTKVNIQRLLLVAIMTASKFFDDFYHNNQQWALIGGIGLQELNVLELDFLFLMTFDLNVKREEYKSFVRKILVLGSGTPEKEEKESKLPEVNCLASAPIQVAEKAVDVANKYNTIDLPGRAGSPPARGEAAARGGPKTKSGSFASSFSSADTERFQASIDEHLECFAEDEAGAAARLAKQQPHSTSGGSSKSVVSVSSTPNTAPASPARPPTKLPPAGLQDGRKMTASPNSA